MDNKTNIKLFNFHNQIEIPAYVEVSSGRYPWVMYGEDNCYSEYLVSLQNKSGKHNAILKGKAAIIGGNGFSQNNLSDAAKLFLKNVNDKDNLDSILAKISYDLEIYGAYALNIIWSKDRTKIAQIAYVDVSKVRIAKPSEKQSEGYWISNDWANTSKHKPEFYNKFNDEDRKAASQILYVKEYRPGNDYYAQPEYIASVNWIILEHEISTFHLSNVSNGFHPSMIVSFTSGVPSEEEMEGAVKAMQKKYEGASNGGKVIFTFSEDKDQVPVITPIELNSSDERFIQLNSDVENGIYQGHRVTNPALFGVKTPGELGNTNNLASDLKVFNAMYARPKQNAIESEFQKLASINGVTDKLVINEFKLDLPVDLTVENLLNIISSPIATVAKKALLKSFGYADAVIDQFLTVETN